MLVFFSFSVVLVSLGWETRPHRSHTLQYLSNTVSFKSTYIFIYFISAFHYIIWTLSIALFGTDAANLTSRNSWTKMRSTPFCCCSTSSEKVLQFRARFCVFLKAFRLRFWSCRCRAAASRYCHVHGKRLPNANWCVETCVPVMYTYYYHNV